MWWFSVVGVFIINGGCWFMFGFQRVSLHHSSRGRGSEGPRRGTPAIPNSLKMVVEVSDFKTLGLFCCQSNPITPRFWLDRMGYVPGEKIYFNAEVENLSRKTMHGSKFQLIEVIKYKDIRLNKFFKLNYTQFKKKKL